MDFLCIVVSLLHLPIVGGKHFYDNNDTIIVSDINHTWGILYHIILSKLFVEWDYKPNTEDGK